MASAYLPKGCRLKMAPGITHIVGIFDPNIHVNNTRSNSKVTLKYYFDHLTAVRQFLKIAEKANKNLEVKGLYIAEMRNVRT